MSSVSTARRRRRTSRASLFRTPVLRADALADLVDLGDEEGAGTSDPDCCRPRVGRIQRCDGSPVAIDQGPFEPLCSAGGSPAMGTKCGAPSARPGQRLGNHEIDVDAVGAEPATGVLSRGEPSSAEKVAKQRGIGELPRGHCEVGVGCVFRNGEVRVARMEVDCLSSDENH